MLPWGHLALGYLLYSPTVRLWRRRGPEGLSVLVLALATQLPDLVDKPLSWVFGLAPQGYSVAHSVLVGAPVALAVGWLLVRRGREETGLAFVVGYLSHLAGDVLLGLALENPYAVDRVLWPLVTLPPYGSDRPALSRSLEYVVEWVRLLVATEGYLLPLLYVGPMVAAALLWLVDGAPGFPRPRGPQE